MSARLAPELQSQRPELSVLWRTPLAAPPSNPAMTKDLQVRFCAVMLALFTVAACVFAWINFQKERDYTVPSDGIWWVEHSGSLFAQRIEANSPADKAGIRDGDRLIAIAETPVHSVASLARQLFRTGAWSRTTYEIDRNGVKLDVPVILVPVDKSLNAGLRLIALVYLGIGLYVLLRRWTAAKSVHFYIFCLVSFVFYAFHYTGKLNTFDQIVYWTNVLAWLLQPALFLHFVLTFPQTKAFVRGHRWVTPLVYAPGLVLLAIHVAVFRWFAASELVLVDPLLLEPLLPDAVSPEPVLTDPVVPESPDRESAD